MTKDILNYLKNKLANIELVVKQGVIPGELDTYEMHECISLIKKLKRMITMIEGDEK